MPDDRKELIAAAARRLLLRRDGKKLTVTDIVNECHITRQTFYYHFEDIPDLLLWMMKRNLKRSMQAQKHGAILNFGSVSGVVGYPFESAYGASKAAIIHLTKNAASENGGNGVRINAISPGWVKTNMMATILDSYKNVGFDNADENVTLGPMGRPGTPEEIANVAAFICSEEASYANGSNFLVDGGMTLG